MADDPVIRLPLDPDEDVSADAGEKSFEKLRHLILAPEQEGLARLRERVESPEQRACDVSAVLPEAIHLRREQDGEEALGAALAPTVETALRESVRKDPTTLADALFPVMGPAIRRSILQTLRQLFESFNQAMDQSLLCAACSGVSKPSARVGHFPNSSSCTAWYFGSSRFS